MEIKRGGVVLCVAPGDYGKPRPAIVVQSDLFNPTHASVTLCPITSELHKAPLFRVDLMPSEGNGLKKRSQVMVDKVTTQSLKRVGDVIGQLSPKDMSSVDNALRLWLSLDEGTP